MSFKILLVDDESSQRELLSGALKKEGYEIIQADQLNIAKELFETNLFDLVITDQKLKDPLGGLKLLKFCKSKNPEIPVVLITAYGDVENAVSAMRSGAYYYLTKPIELDELLLVLKNAFDYLNIIRENRLLQEKYKSDFSEYPIIARSKEMKSVLSIVARVAPYPVSVLISGESGVGKEVVARLIHDTSGRKGNPFIAVNCSAIPETLLEAELFGSEKGAYTGAVNARKGRFELADGGTIFLDEIGEISPVIQVKLLRVISEKNFVRLGGEKTVSVDIRIIAATNRNLNNEIKEGRFREDLFYRLNVVSISIPPLRERRDDILPLTQRIMKTLRKNIPDKEVKDISWEAKKLLLKYNWPGNVRELENLLHRAFVLSRSELIGKEDVDLIKEEGELSLEKIEREHIERVLKITNGNMQKASELLKIHRNTLREKISKYKLK